MIMRAAVTRLAEACLIGKQKTLLLIVMGFLAGCASHIEMTDVPSSATPPTLNTPTATQTPFRPLPATPTPSDINLWISPALPVHLQAPLQELRVAGGRGVRIVSEPGLADVRAEPGAEVPLAHWIYAAAVPFPTIRDGLSLDALRAAWAGQGEDFKNLFVASDIVAALEWALGERSESTISLPEAAELLDQAWQSQPSLAIIPFEALEPRWKVLELEGISPLRLDFDPLRYALTIPYGLSGDPVAIDSLANDIAWPASNRDPERLTVLIMTGVTALARETAWKMEEKGIRYPAEKILSWFQEADLIHISHEAAFWDSCPAPQPGRVGMRFCSQPEHIELFEAIGVDLIELTGNHLNDYGTEGLTQSLALYRERGWQVFGGGENLEQALQPALIEHHGNRLAFLGCNAAGPPAVWAKEDSPGAAPCDTEELSAELGRLREMGYLPIFTFQWMEYYDPSPSLQQAREFRAMIDAGAVIVSGSQAHRPQTFEFHGDGFIHYGLGNLFFDQMWSVATRQEFIDRHIFYDGGHISTELLTAMLEDFAQPRPMTSEERKSLLEEIFASSGW